MGWCALSPALNFIISMLPVTMRTLYASSYRMYSIVIGRMQTIVSEMRFFLLVNEWCSQSD